MSVGQILKRDHDLLYLSAIQVGARFPLFLDKFRTSVYPEFMRQSMRLWTYEKETH